MKSYNGFSPAQRTRALAWLKKEYEAGRRQPPTVCQACGQTEGIIEAHSEDYSEPYGDHIGAYSFCYTCHMMLHCRFRNPQAWERYKEAIRRGVRYRPVYRRDFNAIVPFLNGQEVEHSCHQAQGCCLLDDIVSGACRRGG
ncbi:MAG TPA: hypothetical protein VKU00_27435 [Chthonomonadaceae bacterium]|nr:hypothetical protein [Chthonomonadaceae bacterium]